MKKLLLLICSTIFAFGQINAIVSIVPQKYFADKIAGEKANITVMVFPGNSPHTYEPKPSQMKDLTKANVYFKIGIEFEKIWLKKFQSINKTMRIVDSSKGIKRIPMINHNHGENDHKHDSENNLDPHVWLSPKNGKIIAKNIYDTFVNLDSKNKNYYTMNYKKILKEIEETNTKINNILLKTDDMAKFIVFHPSWGYFAKDYRLTQVALELGGKKPKAKHIQNIIKETKKDYFKVIITAPEFSDNIAKTIAHESGIDVVKISPLAQNWSENLLKFAKAVAKEY